MGDVNYTPLFQKIHAYLKSYKPHILWFGLIGIIKTDILPKLLYAFQAIPDPLSSGFFLSLNKAIRAFIWHHKKTKF